MKKLCGVCSCSQARDARDAGGALYQFVVDREQVNERIGDLVKRQDLSRYVL